MASKISLKERSCVSSASFVLLLKELIKYSKKAQKLKNGGTMYAFNEEKCKILTNLFQTLANEFGLYETIKTIKK